MLDAYLEWPAWLRTILALGVLCAGVYLTVSGYQHRYPIENEPESYSERRRLEAEARGAAATFRFGVLVCGLGMTMLCFSGKSSSEKQGYRF